MEIDVANQVVLTDEYFRVAFPDAGVGPLPLVVTLSLHDAYRDRLQVTCSHDGEVALFHRGRGACARPGRKDAAWTGGAAR